MSSLDGEYLFWIPPTHTDVGVMPGFYERATTESDRLALIDMGGLDVSANAQAWTEYHREHHDAALSTA